MSFGNTFALNDPDATAVRAIAHRNSTVDRIATERGLTAEQAVEAFKTEHPADQLRYAHALNSGRPKRQTQILEDLAKLMKAEAEASKSKISVLADKPGPGRRPVATAELPMNVRGYFSGRQWYAYEIDCDPRL